MLKVYRHIYRLSNSDRDKKKKKYNKSTLKSHKVITLKVMKMRKFYKQNTYKQDPIKT